MPEYLKILIASGFLTPVSWSFIEEADNQLVFEASPKIMSDIGGDVKYFIFTLDLANSNQITYYTQVWFHDDSWIGFEGYKLRPLPPTLKEFKEVMWELYIQSSQP